MHVRLTRTRTRERASVIILPSNATIQPTDQTTSQPISRPVVQGKPTHPHTRPSNMRAHSESIKRRCEGVGLDGCLLNVPATCAPIRPVNPSKRRCEGVGLDGWLLNVPATCAPIRPVNPSNAAVRELGWMVAYLTSQQHARPFAQ